MRSVSIIVPTYNYGQFVSEAIQSVLAQTYPVREIIVVDDGSTDETEVIVKSFGDVITYIRQENSGVAAARNTGIKRASGRFVAFLDADDTWQPEKIERQVAKFAEDESIGLVHCGMREFDSKTGEKIRIHLTGGEGWVAEEIALWERPVINGPGGSIMVRHEVFDRVGGFDPELKNGEDWEFCFRVAMKFKVGFVREPLVNYRNHGTNASKDVAEMERSTLKAWGKVFSTEDPRIRRLKRRSYGNLHKVLAGSYLHNREFEGFAKNTFKSLWYRPSYFPFYLRTLLGIRSSESR